MLHPIPVMCGAALLLTLIYPCSAQAADYRAGPLVIAHPWSRPTPPVATVGAVYLSITNAGKRADRLLSVDSPVSTGVEIHESRVERGVLEMRPVSSVDCPPGATVSSAPGGLHLMLVGLAHPLVAGTEFPLILHFRDAGTVAVRVTVEALE